MLDKDERGAFNAGGHPWDVEPGVTSTLLLFNGDSTPQKVNLRFGTPSGPWMRRFTLEPMETRAISINELVGMQEKDDSGLALPSNAQSGELGWQSDSTWVSGRLLQTSAALGMARSFSCSQWVYACAFTLSPTPSLSLYLNNTGDLSEIPDWAVYTGFHPPTTCSCANPTSGNTTLYDSWQSGNTSIATITSGGTSSASVWQGVGVGSTTSYFYGNNMFLGGGSLQCQASQPANVAPVITSISPSSGPVGGSISVTISGSGFGTSPTVSADAGVTATVRSATNTQIVATFAIADSDPGGNTGIYVTAQVQKSQGKPFYKQVPTSLSVSSATAVNCAGSHNYGVLADVKYQVLDQVGKSIQAAGMTPYENGILFDGSPIPPNQQLGLPTASDGTFHDNPIGLCLQVPYTKAYAATQNITIQVITNGVQHTVRSQTVTATSPSGTAGFGHGTEKNNLPNPSSPDINVSR